MAPNHPSHLRKTARSDYLDRLEELLAERVIGQNHVLSSLADYVRMYYAGLSPEGRPVGVFLLLGPTGTGKTHTVEALAEILHGDRKQLLKIDCGEFQLDHEVAKLTGAPPGYLGHRETVPILSQQRLNAVTSDKCKLAIVLFDEIEKAAPSFTRILLGILDKAILRLGDNTTVNFENTLIFMTSNLGAEMMMRELSTGFGFGPAGDPQKSVGSISGKLELIAVDAVRRQFAPEFINRIDVIATYRPLTQAEFQKIIDLQLQAWQQHIDRRLADRAFRLEVSQEAKKFLLQKGTSMQYGARELKRVILHHLIHPLSALMTQNKVLPGSVVTVNYDPIRERLEFHCQIDGTLIEPQQEPCVLVAEPSEELALFLEHPLAAAGYRPFTVCSIAELREELEHVEPAAVLLDTELPPGEAVRYAFELAERYPLIPLILFGYEPISQDEWATCEELGIKFLKKPFLIADLLKILDELASSHQRLAA